MLETYLQATLPPAAAVVDVSPVAAEKIRAVTDAENGCGDGGLSLDELRAQAFAEFGAEFFAKLAAEETALLTTLATDVERLWAHWNRLEQIRGLEHWSTHGQRLYGPRPVAVLQVSSGFGHNKTPVTARQVFDAFGEVIARGGR